MTKRMKFMSLLRGQWPLLLLTIINVVLFSLNFRVGYYFAFSDMPLLELDPNGNLWIRLFVWQMKRGFGLELGQELGYVVPLAFISMLELVGISPLNINYLYNIVLFVFPSISIYVLARVFFNGVRNEKYVAFLAGFFGNYNFYSYITGYSPFFAKRWPLVTVPLILAYMMMFLRTGKRKHLALLSVFSILAVGAFPALVFLVAPFILAALYLAYYLLYENESRMQTLRRIGIIVCVELLTFLPLIFASMHYYFFTNALGSRFVKLYTAGLLETIRSGTANSDLLNSFRLIGSIGWNYIANWKGEYAYTYYRLFVSSPVFILSSFMLPLLAFGSLLFRDTKKVTAKLLFLSSVSVLFLFLIKGGSEPFGSLFAWAVLNVTYFQIFRTPFDKAGIVLAITMSMAAAYTTVRILTLQSLGESKVSARSKRYLNALNLRTRIKPFLVVLLISSIAFNTYPAIAGQVLEQKAFFKIPPYYSDVANYVASDPTTYKILGLPEMNFVMLYKWGYFGVGIDGWILNKPVLHYSYIGSDLYDEAIISAILSEVAFRSGTRSYQIMGWSNFEPIFQNDNGSRSVINLERVKYLGYMLRMANVGIVIYRLDVVGDGDYWLNGVDRARYDELFDALQRVGVLSPPLKFGSLLLYRVLGCNPIIYDTSLRATYNVNNYEVMLDSYDTNSRLAILSSFFGYDHNIAFTYNSLNSTRSQVYVPLLMRQYYNRIIGNLHLDSAVGNQSNPKSIDKAKSDAVFLENQLGMGYTYYDQIGATDTFDVYVNLMTAQNSTLQKVIGELNIAIELAQSVSATSLPSNVTEKIRTIMNHVTDFLGANTPSAMIPAFYLRDVRDLNSALDKGRKRDVIDLITELADGFRLGDYTAESSSLIGQNLYYAINGQQQVMNVSNLKEWPGGAGWYRIGRATLESGTISIGTSFWYERPILLLPVKEQNNKTPAPSITFSQVNPTEYLVTVSGASQNFVLNFLQSYSDGWKLFLRKSPSSTLGSVVYSSNGSTQVVGPQLLFTEEQLTAPVSSPVFDSNHMLLNGFANSWYIDLLSLAQRGLIDRTSNNTYSFQLSIIYLPQSYLYYSAAVSIVGLTILAMILTHTRPRKRRAR